MSNLLYSWCHLLTLLDLVTLEYLSIDTFDAAGFLDESEGLCDDGGPPLRREPHVVRLLALPEDQLKLEGSPGGLWGPACRRGGRGEPNDVGDLPGVGRLHRAGVESWEGILREGQDSPVLPLPRVLRHQVRAGLVRTDGTHPGFPDSPDFFWNVSKMGETLLLTPHSGLEKTNINFSRCFHINTNHPILVSFYWQFALFVGNLHFLFTICTLIRNFDEKKFITKSLPYFAFSDVEKVTKGSESSPSSFYNVINVILTLQMNHT